MADPAMVGDPAFWAVFGALGGAMLALVVIVGLAIYIYVGFALMTIANKTKVPNGWLGFIPIANIYLMTQIAKVSGWWTLGLLAALIPVLGGILVGVLMVYLWWQVAERVGRPGWWGILMIVPILNLVIVGMMAWGR